MSILDKHPSPWTWARDRITDGDSGIPDCIEPTDFADGTVLRAGNGRLEFASPGILRLILAAPELLAALKEYDRRVSVDCIRDENGEDGNAFTGRVTALIERIEKGGGT